MIRVRGLTAVYRSGALPAVDRLDLDAGAGEVLGLVGPNGAGKTTTLKVLAGLLRPTAGEIRVAGVDLAADPRSARRLVGYLPDGFGVEPDLTCRELLEFTAAAAGLGGDRRRAALRQALALTDLQAKADTLAGGLSRGMRQRLALARVLVTEPRVLLLDEPASGLDPRARVEVREILRELGAMGRTVVVSSHVLSDLAAACTRLAVLTRGRLAFAGSVEEALERAARARCVVECAVAEGPAAARAALEAGPGPPLGDLEEHGDRLRVVLRAAATGPAGPGALGSGAAAVARRLHAEGLGIRHLATSGADLEDAFLALTREEGAA